jgi:hypothetical protein
MRYYLFHEELRDLTSIRPDTAANKRRDVKALSKISLLVQPQCLVYLENAETTMDTWNAWSCMLLGKLFDVKFTTNSEVHSHNTRRKDYLFILPCNTSLCKNETTIMEFVCSISYH